MSEDSDEEKTEDPTPHRREKARQEGQIPRSRELGSLLMLCAGWALMTQSGEHLARTLMQTLRALLTFDNRGLTDPRLMLHQLHFALTMVNQDLLPLIVGLLLTGIAGCLLIGGLHLGGHGLKCDLKRLNPIAGFSRLFSAQVLSELLKGSLKVILVGSGCALYLYKNKLHFIQLVNTPLSEALPHAMDMILHCLLMAVLFIIPVAGYDIVYQLLSHLKKLRMTRQEIRDEFKQQEGDPHIKNHIKQMQRAAARGRMMADVPNADVIVNNPTHYSVALAYNDQNMGAPVVLAIGAGDTALKIREMGKRHKIPMLEAPPLARALYRHGEIGRPIPAALYETVAEVLAWVYSLRRWRLTGGVKPASPKDLRVPEQLDFNQERSPHG